MLKSRQKSWSDQETETNSINAFKPLTKLGKTTTLLKSYLINLSILTNKMDKLRYKYINILDINNRYRKLKNCKSEFYQILE